MAIYYKPQSPIQSGEDFIYPITTADQVILSDGSRLEQNGQISIGGGPAGYSPVRGTDYWTEADIAEIRSYVDDAILGGAW